MPERKIVCLQPEGETTKTFIDASDKLSGMFNEGWILDPIFGGKALKLEHAIVYHLVFYSPEELEAMQAEEILQDPEVQSVKSVGYEEVDSLIAEGYKPRDYYAKNVVMIKMKVQEVTAKDG